MRRKKLAVTNGCIMAIVGTLVPGLAHPARADFKTFGDIQDAMIFGTSANVDTGSSSGAGPGMFAGADGSLNKKRSLVEFNIAGNIPAGAHITDVKLTLVVGQIAGSAGGSGTPPTIPSRTFTLFDLNQPWSEGTTSGFPGNNIGGSGQGSPSTVGDTSWDFSSITGVSPTTGTTWNNGSNLHGGNFSSTPSGVLTVTANAQQGFVITPTGATSVATGSAYTWDSAATGSSQMLADVQNWLDNPSSDDGWIMRQTSAIDGNGNTIDPESTKQSFLGFWTKEGAAANNLAASAPMLTVTYDPVPEPATAALALLAAPLLLRRRRSQI